ncbi:hypothetical protein ATY77_16400 [Rhizobium sp. R634]|nr:hypothetical protein ATY77_16400 [Rhizobium sp. R634]
MKHERKNSGRNHPHGSAISRPFRALWHRLMEPIAALWQSRQPQPMRVVAEARDRNRARQRY